MKNSSLWTRPRYDDHYSDRLLGAFLIALSVLMALINMILSARNGQVAGANPWDAPTLEWATPSPPPSYNFAHIPLVSGDNPLWEHRERLQVMRGLRLDKRELVLTTALDATPDVRDPSARPSIWPLLAAIAVGGLFLGSIFTPWAVVVGAIPATIALIAWFWPKQPPAENEEDDEI